MRYCTPIVNWLDLVKRLAWVIGVSLLLVAWMTAEALGLSPWLQYTLLALFIFLAYFNSGCCSCIIRCMD
ncbi:hypothetical protein Pmar_PMAR028805, partial [Perkinsus marinus ATCC 50983]